MIQLKLCSDFVLGKLEVKDEMNKDDPFPENIQGNCTYIIFFNVFSLVFLLFKASAEDSFTHT